MFSLPKNTILVARVMHVYTNMFVNIYANNIIPFIFSSKRTNLVARVMHVYTNISVNIYMLMIWFFLFYPPKKTTATILPNTLLIPIPVAHAWHAAYMLRVMHVYTNMFVNIYANNIIPFIFSSKRTILVARVMHVYTNIFVNVYVNDMIFLVFSV